MMHRTLGLGFLVFVTAAIHAQAQTLLKTWNGTHDYESLGTNVASAGDLNGDGVPDIVVGAAGAGWPMTTGAVNVYSGASGALLRSHTGPVNPNTQFAQRIAVGGDVDGDGVGDYMTSNIRGTGAFPNSGVVYVFSGATGVVLHTVSGVCTGCSLGYAIDILGDLDGDGRAEFAAGTHLENGGGAYGGAVRIYSGATGALLRLHTGPPGGNLFNVARLGSIDGDGVADYAIADFLRDSPTGVIGAGVIEIRSGASGALLRSIYGTGSAGCFGCEVSDVGDIDLDGSADLLASHWEGNGAGFVNVHSGATGALLKQFFGDCANERFGISLAAVGDCNLDGIVDIGTGAWQGGYGRVFSGLDGALLFEWHEPQGDHFTGLQIAGAGDLDGDGKSDVLTGFAASNVGGSAAGRVRAWSIGLPQSIGVLFGSGNGTGTACPCGNAGQAQAGCANSTGFGAELRARGSTSVAEDSLFFQASRTKPNVSCVLFSSPQKLAGGAGVVFHDGLLVIGSPIKRRGQTGGCNGVTTFGPGLAPNAHWQPGTTLYFQTWYRDSPGPCGSGSNTTNGVELTFTP